MWRFGDRHELVSELHPHVRAVAATIELDRPHGVRLHVVGREPGSGIKEMPADVVAPMPEELVIGREEGDRRVPLPVRARLPCGFALLERLVAVSLRL